MERGLKEWLRLSVSNTFLSAPYHLNPLKERMSNIHLIEMVCRAHDSSMQIKVTVKVMGFTLEFCVCSISPLPQEGFSLSFVQILFLVRLCRTYDSAMQTQGQGHR